MFCHSFHNVKSIEKQTQPSGNGQKRCETAQGQVEYADWVQMGEKLWELEQLDLLYIVWEGKTQISECKLEKSRSYFTLRKTPILFKWPINSEIPVAVNTSNTQDCGLFVLFPIKMNQSSLWTECFQVPDRKCTRWSRCWTWISSLVLATLLFNLKFTVMKCFYNLGVVGLNPVWGSELSEKSTCLSVPLPCPLLMLVHSFSRL